MFYSKIASVIAGLALIVGVFSVTMGFYIISSGMSEVEALRYLGSKTTGQMIDKGIYTILFAVILGVLTEISNSVSIISSKKQNKK